jgi:hypothetical protein
MIAGVFSSVVVFATVARFFSQGNFKWLRSFSTSMKNI